MLLGFYLLTYTKLRNKFFYKFWKILSDLEHGTTYNKKSYHLKWASLHFTSLHLLGLFWCPYSLVRDNLLWFVSCPFSPLNTWICFVWFLIGICTWICSNELCFIQCPIISKLINLRVSLKVMIVVDAQLVGAYAHGFAHFVLFDSSLVANGFCSNSPCFIPWPLLKLVNLWV
jgi:hypothetical protein